MKTRAMLGIFMLGFSWLAAQNVPLFKSHEPLHIRATGSIKSIKKNSNDSTFATGKFEFEENGKWTTVNINTRTRGNWRLRNCYFAPLKIEFKKKDVQGTLFDGNKSLKVVFPCLNSSDKNSLVHREYLTYRLYEILSPYFFNTRLATLHLTEVSRKKPREMDLLVFLVEDNSLVAKRTNTKVVKKKGIHPSAFDEMQSVRNDFFQYMIGNADWSAVEQHNSNTLYASSKFIPLSYDFDMSGLVNAPYAHTNAPTLGTGDPRERVYRGFCKSEEAMQKVRQEFLDKEAAVHAAIDAEPGELSSYDIKDMHGYVNEFFDILRNDDSFQNAIVKQCRIR
jgi:hypothetical protein